MKIAISQINYVVGDFEGNSKKIIDACRNASNIDMIVFSELSISGYYPWDLIYRESFHQRQNEALSSILQASEMFDFYIVIGLVRKNQGIGKPFFNSLLVIKNGRIVFDYDKKLLPTYNIFDEKRHFEEGRKNGVAELFFGNAAKKIGFIICEDGWNGRLSDYQIDPTSEMEGVEAIVSINASPSNIGKQFQRDRVFSEIAERIGAPLIYANQIGGNDEVVFDGASFALDGKGRKVLQLPSFEEGYGVFDSESSLPIQSSHMAFEEFAFKQTSLGLKDYLSKLGIEKVVVGASGGIDSSLTIAIAALTLGADNVEAITMPSAYSSHGSVSDSEALCENLGVKLYNFPIANVFDSMSDGFLKAIGEPMIGLSSENSQARIRGAMLMAFSNKKGHILLTTGNKSEISVGYFTLYGDSNGGLNLIGDLYKTEVYSISRWINSEYGEIIPVSVIEKEPSAELSPGQRDSDSLPPYETLDSILMRELEGDFLSPYEKRRIDTILSGLPQTQLEEVRTKIDRAEFKRKQAAPIIRIHPLAFGGGRRVPIVHK